MRKPRRRKPIRKLITTRISTIRAGTSLIIGSPNQHAVKYAFSRRDAESVLLQEAGKSHPVHACP